MWKPTMRKQTKARMKRVVKRKARDVNVEKACVVMDVENV